MSAIDFPARGLAMGAMARLDRARLVDRLAGGIARAADRLPGLSAAPPLLAAPSTGDDGFIAGGTLWAPCANGEPAPGLYECLRGRWTTYHPGFPFDQYVQNRPLTVGSLGSTGPGASFGLIRFWSDAPVLQIRSFGNGAPGGYRLKVDGDYAATGLLGTLTGGAEIWQRVSWGDGSAADRMPRLYEIEAEADFAFGGIKTSAVSRVWPAPLAGGVRLLVHGDSFVGGAFIAAEHLQPQLPVQIGLRMGQPGVVVSGEGGTGFIANNGGASPTFRQRVQPDVIANAPEVIVEMGGTNDSTLINEDPDVMRDVVTAWLGDVVSALPDVLVFMTGPMTGRVAGAATIAVRDGKKAAAARFPRNVVFIDNIEEGWVTGTGYLNGPRGDGNADWVTGAGSGDDSVHPSALGQAYLATRVVAGIADRLASVRV